jgi:hypothetical protein
MALEQPLFHHGQAGQEGPLPDDGDYGDEAEVWPDTWPAFQVSRA